VLRKCQNIVLLLLCSTYSLSAQTGGTNVYQFLNLMQSGIVSSLGGSNVSLMNGDVNLASCNPSLLSPEMNNNLALNYVNYLAGINYGMSVYSFTLPGIGNSAAGITYLNYGAFREADESGVITGTFRAAEYALSLMFSREIDSSFRAGVTVKPVLSHLEKYTSFGIAVDIGVSWQSRDRLTSAGAVIRNAGFQVTTYDGETREKLPFEIQAGISRRLAHAPFRFSATLRHLERFDLTHDYETPSGTSGSGFFEDAARHLVLGAEVLPHKNFYFSAGFNYQRRKELMVESGTAMAGFSWGFGINTTYLSLGFGRASFHLAGASNHFSIVVRPEMIFKKFKE